MKNFILVTMILENNFFQETALLDGKYLLTFQNLYWEDVNSELLKVDSAVFILELKD